MAAPQNPVGGMQVSLPVGEADQIRPRGIGELLDATFRLYRDQFKYVLLTSLCFLLPYAILSGLTTARDATLLQSLASQFSNGTGTGVPSRGVVTQLVTTSGLVVLFSLIDWIVVLPLMYGTLLRLVVARRLEGQVIAFGEGVRCSVRRWMPVVGTIVLLWLVVMAFVLVAAALIGLSAAALGGSPTAIAVTVVVILSIAGIAVCVWLSVRLSMVSSAVREDQVRLWQSVKRSWELTRGNFWRCLGFFAAVWLIVLVLLSGASGATGVLHNPGLSAAVSAIVSLFVTPFGMLATAELYVDLRIRTDVLDLRAWLPSTPDQ